MSLVLSSSPLLQLSAPLENVQPNDVVIGRGRRIKEHPGNLRFQNIIKENLNGYANALTKTKKSLIILKILNIIKEDESANFVKLDNNGTPFVVEESQARITIAQALRDSLNQHYKSSRQHKQRKRLQNKRATATAYMQMNAMTQAKQNLNTSLTLLHRELNCESPTPAPLAFPALSMYDSDCSSSISSSHSPSPTSCMALKDILEEAVGLATQKEEEETTQMDDVFTSLFKAFAPQSIECNPFEPTPLMPLVEPTPLPEPFNSNDEASYGSLEQDWEPFPLF